MIPEYCYSPLGLIQHFIFSTSQNPVCRQALQTLSQPPEFVSLRSYFFVLALTCLLELPFYIWVIQFQQFRQPRQSLSPILPGQTFNRSRTKNSVLGFAATLLCNCFSHPGVYFLFPYLGSELHLQYDQVLFSAEIFAPLSEALILILIWRVCWKQAFFGMIMANLFSWWVGIYLV